MTTPAPIINIHEVVIRVVPDGKGNIRMDAKGVFGTGQRELIRPLIPSECTAIVCDWLKATLVQNLHPDHETWDRKGADEVGEFVRGTEEIVGVPEGDEPFTYTEVHILAETTEDGTSLNVLGWEVRASGLLYSDGSPIRKKYAVEQWQVAAIVMDFITMIANMSAAQADLHEAQKAKALEDAQKQKPDASVAS